ncbi:18.1 kDa class I heat shock protein-like [Macadamia integrifolia]|uniref:18.1 kDa class I heat shock protein-like n=1 Tax=Macadamia integrifolia TaxID=60698 RepID=UPI001C501B2C|nr:18.1 kDa class I heat shock protein-like [Macadamia integrifolia]
MSLPSFFSGQRTNIYDPTSCYLWDPFEGFPFSSSALTNTPISSRDTSALSKVNVDWKETPEAHVFIVDLPGLNKEEVKIVIDGSVLQISGERRKEEEEKNSSWHKLERTFGNFLRRFRLPENTKKDQVKANMQNGVLTVIVPKQEEKKPQAKRIEIAG